MIQKEIHALLALTLTRGVGPILAGRLVQCLGSAKQAIAAGPEELACVRGIGSRKSAEIRRQIDQVLSDNGVERELEQVASEGVCLLPLSDAGYPALLRHIADPPPLLYTKGTWRDDDAIALAIVGSRRCTQYGRSQAHRFAGLCAEVGLCVVSGGAYGVDAAAHDAALRHGGRTVAVLGSGLGRLYPAEHVGLFSRIADGAGLLVSELPMAAPPVAEHFPRRNRIISGLALGVLVIEAAARSGALITARLAAEDHGREVMAVPGPVDAPTSEGCHRMIREGWATLVTDLGDVLDALGETGHLLRAGPAGPSGYPAAVLSASQRAIVATLDGPLAANQIATRTGLAVHIIQSDLTMLEIRGIVEKSGTTFSRRGG